MPITHAHITAIPDDGSDVGANAWDAPHITTGMWDNVLHSINNLASPYHVLPGDAGETILITGIVTGTVQFDAPSGYATDHVNMVANSSTVLWTVILTGTGTFTLQPGQSMLVANCNNVWIVLVSASFTIPTTNTNDFDVVASVQNTSINPNISWLHVEGAQSIGDGGAALYLKVPSQPTNSFRIQSADGAFWQGSEPVITPQMFFAKGDGVQDDTPNIQVAIDYLEAVHHGGVLFLPSGNYLIATGPIKIGQALGAGVRVVGASRNSVILNAGTHDVEVVRILAGSIAGSLESLSIYGYGLAAGGTFAPTTNALHILGGPEWNFQNLYVAGGVAPIFIDGFLAQDNIFLHVNATAGYGIAGIQSQGANHFVRCKLNMDQDGTPRNSTGPYIGRANGTHYNVGDVVSLSGYLIVCTVAGTTAVSAPALQHYGTPIVDGSVTWLLSQPVNYSAIFISGVSGVMENHFTQCDFSGNYDISIRIDYASAITYVSESVIAHGVSANTGLILDITDCEVAGGCSIVTAGTFGGFLSVHDCHWAGGSGGWNVTCGAGTADIHINDNELQGGTISVSGVTDYYVITNNLRATVSDAASGANKTVSGNHA